MGVRIITGIPLIYRSNLGTEEHRIHFHEFQLGYRGCNAGNSDWSEVGCASHDNSLKTTGAQWKCCWLPMIHLLADCKRAQICHQRNQKSRPATAWCLNMLTLKNIKDGPLQKSPFSLLNLTWLNSVTCLHTLEILMILQMLSAEHGWLGTEDLKVCLYQDEDGDETKCVAFNYHSKPSVQSMWLQCLPCSHA